MRTGGFILRGHEYAALAIITDIRIFAVSFAFASILAWDILVDAANTIYA